MKTPRFSYTISATPGKRPAAPHGTRRIREKGRWPLPMVDSGALAASQHRVVTDQPGQDKHWHLKHHLVSSSQDSATLVQCGFQYRLWNCTPIPPLAVKTIGTKSIPHSCSHRSLYLPVPGPVFVSSAALVPAFGLRRDSPHTTCLFLVKLGSY